MGRESACNAGDTGNTGLTPGSVFLLENPTKRSLVDHNPKGCKQSDTTDDYALRAHPKLFLYCFISVQLVTKTLCNQHSSKHSEYRDKVRFMEFTFWFKENICNK